jgi:hypothetical protein
MNVAGFSTVREIAPEREWSFQEGWSTVRRWEGTEMELTAFSPALQAPGVRLNIRPARLPYHVLELRVDNAQDGTEDDPDAQMVTEFSVKPSRLEKDIFDSPKWKQLVATAPAEAEQLRAWRENIDLENEPAVANAIALLFRADIRASVEAYWVPQFVLHRTITVPAGWSGVADVTFAGYQFSAAHLIITESIPAPYSNYITTIGGWWVKDAPEIGGVVGGKTAIVHEWHHATEWTELQYPKFTP